MDRAAGPAGPLGDGTQADTDEEVRTEGDDRAPEHDAGGCGTLLQCVGKPPVKRHDGRHDCHGHEQQRPSDFHQRYTQDGRTRDEGGTGKLGDGERMGDQRAVDEKRRTRSMRESREGQKQGQRSDDARDCDFGGGDLGARTAPPSHEKNEGQPHCLPRGEEHEQIESHDHAHRPRTEQRERSEIRTTAALGPGDEERHESDRCRHEQERNARPVDPDVPLGGDRPYPDGALDQLKALVAVRTSDVDAEVMISPRSQEKLDCGDTR